MLRVVENGPAPIPERLAVVELRAVAHGAMPPLHTRAEDETYHVLEGEISFYVGRETTHARPGDLVIAPSGVPRTFRVTSAQARWLVLTSVRSLARYEDFARAVVPPNADRDWSTPEDAAAVAAIAAANGIEVLGPPGMLPAERRRH